MSKLRVLWFTGGLWLFKRKRKIYHALNHPLRQEIVELLMIHGVLSASELKDRLNIGPGKLYYHLENLGNLIEQTEQRKYRLSKEGEKAYKLLVSSESFQVNERVRTSGPLSPLFNKIKSTFLLDWFFLRVYESPVRHIPESFVLILFGGWLCYISQLQPILLYYISQNQPGYWSLIHFLIGWLTIYAIAEVLCFGLFRRKSGNISLLVGSAISMFPLILFSGVWFLNSQLEWNLKNLYGGMLLRGLLLLCQGWTLSLLTISVSRAKKISVDKASLISFTIAYLNIAIFILQKGI